MRRVAAAFVLAIAATGVAAIDNPDAPDRVAAFERRAQPYEQHLAATDGGSQAAREGVAYAQFLNDELNTAYKLLLSRLPGLSRVALVDSQRRWLGFRDAEFRFIEQQWTRERNGSSASLSVAGYRNSLVKERVRQLLQYGAEYP